MIRVVLPAVTVAKYLSISRTVTYYNLQPHFNNLYFIFMMIFKKGLVLKGSLLILYWLSPATSFTYKIISGFM